MSGLSIPREVIYVMRGLPASGKTTHARGYTSQVKRVSKDDLRAMVGGPYTQESEEFIKSVRDFLINHALNQGFSVVVDDTNLNPAHIDVFRKIAKKHRAHVEVVEMDTPVFECIERDLARPNGVGAKVILGMYESWYDEE